MAEKQLIVAVEGSAAMGPFWQTILSEYLEKMIRYFFIRACCIVIKMTFNLHYVPLGFLSFLPFFSMDFRHLVFHCGVI